MPHDPLPVGRIGKARELSPTEMFNAALQRRADAIYLLIMQPAGESVTYRAFWTEESASKAAGTGVPYSVLRLPVQP